MSDEQELDTSTAGLEIPEEALSELENQFGTGRVDDDDDDFRSDEQETDDSQVDDATDEQEDSGSTELLQQMAAGGIDYRDKYKTDAELLRGLQEQKSVIGRKEQYAELGRQYEQARPQIEQAFQLAQAYQQMLAQQGQQRQPQQGPLEWNPDWVNQVDIDPTTGMATPKPGYPPEVATYVNHFRNLEKTEYPKLISNPVGHLLPQMLPHLDQRVQAMIEQRLQQYQQGASEQEFAKNFLLTNTWVWQDDKVGSPQGLSERGKRLTAKLDTAPHYIQTEQDRLHWALRELSMEDKLNQVVAERQKQPTRRAPTGNRGSQSASEAPPDLGLAAQLKANLKHDGSYDDFLRRYA